MTWECHLASNIGGRDEQQDRMGVFEMGGGARLVALADGMGGHADGAIAAQTVIDTAAAAAAGGGVESPQQFLISVCNAAHIAIRRIGEERGTKPASTCVLLYLHADTAHWCHVGDSRLYHVNAERAIALTEDHSVRGLMLTEGAAAAALASAGDGLYMCLGGQNPVSPDTAASCLLPGDAMLLCSDGFWQQVDAEEIRAVVASTRHPGDALDGLVATARARGGNGGDNISALLATRQAPRLWTTWRRLTGGR